MAKHRNPNRDVTGGNKADPTGVSRRQLLGMGAAAAGAAAAGSLISGTSSADAAPPPLPLAPAGSTLAQTLLTDTPDPVTGYRHLVVGPGEATLQRADLLGGVTPAPGTRTPLLSIGHLTDMHVVDAQSPARVEFLDRLDDPGSPLASLIPFQGAYRPQEMLATHVAEAMVQSINGLGGGPVTGRPIDFTVSTGDNSDNTQQNEVRWHIDLLDGGQLIRPDSGTFTKWQGVGGSDDRDTAYWHPDGTPPFGTIDNYRGSRGFPTVPGLLDRCRAQFTATGLKMPWYAVFGNHDGLVQGTVPSLGVLNAVAVGSLKPVAPPTGIDLAAVAAAAAAGDASALKILLTAGPVKQVKADKNRKMLTRKQTVAEYFTTHNAPGPVGHGYTATNRQRGTAYYSFDPRPGVPIHCISMDTCDQNGNADGSLDSTQFAWLQNELKANSAHYLDTSGNIVAGNGPDKLIIIFSHHTVATMGNTLGVGRITGAQVSALFLRFPNVVLWINGHTHRNTVTPYSRAGTAAVGGGFWEVNTAAHIDWPEQSRVVEVVDNGDGTLSIFGTIIDHAAPVSWPPTPTSPLELAALSRELGANDPQRDAETATVDGKRGARSDRNVELLMRSPFHVV